MDKEKLISVFLGVDVGSASVRAVAIDIDGKSLADHEESISIHHPKENFYEQSSDQIWNATCNVLKKSVGILDKRHVVKGIGFAATCSLVVLNEHGKPLSISENHGATQSQKTTDRIWDVIMWMDHRAVDQAERINCSKHERLRNVGDKISPEMHPPKLLWLKEHLPNVFKNASHFMDLSDYLVYKASGSLTRSSCTTVCKFLCSSDGGVFKWDSSFWQTIGLPELIDSPKIGTTIQTPGSHCGYLSPEMAKILNLQSDRVAVGAALIDAHAGVLGVLATKTSIERPIDIEEKLIVIAGTSACHMALSKRAHFVPGVWGPYFGVVLPDYWLNEAGQNVVGPVLDDVVMDSGDSTVADRHHDVLQFLERYELENGTLATCQLTRELHVWPDYRGNRSPLADPFLTAALSGVRLRRDCPDGTMLTRAKLYLAHCQALAYGTRMIREALEERRGRPFRCLLVCGGLRTNGQYVQAHADACQLPVMVPDDVQPVARGAAMLGAYAAGVSDPGSSSSSSLMETAVRLGVSGRVHLPREETREYHDRKYRAFRLLGQTQVELRHIMKEKPNET